MSSSAVWPGAAIGSGRQIVLAVMGGGRITELGSHQELSEADGAYTALWRTWQEANPEAGSELTRTRRSRGNVSNCDSPRSEDEPCHRYLAEDLRLVSHCSGVRGRIRLSLTRRSHPRRP